MNSQVRKILGVKVYPEIRRGKFVQMKNYLSENEKLAVLALKQIPREGMFNEIILNSLNEKKVDKCRMIFKMIADQASSDNGSGKKRMQEVIGEVALNAVLRLFH